MIRRFQIIAALLAILVSGCMSTGVRSTVSVFHDLPPTAQPLKYATLPFIDQKGSLEYKAYDQLVKAALNKHGYVETVEANADVLVFMRYGIDNGREVLSSYPVIGQTGTLSSYTMGTITSYGGYAAYSGTTYNTPTFGVIGTGTRTDTVYTRFLRMEFVDRTELAAGKLKKRYEATVVSAGASSQIAEVMPAMINAIFEDFPGQSGSIHRY